MDATDSQAKAPRGSAGAVGVGLIVVAVVVAGIVWASRRGEGDVSPRGGRGPVAFPVEVVPVEARRVEFRVSAVGSVEAFEVAEVTARVSGVVERVAFAEGDMVVRGQALVEIEPERFRLAAASAQAALERARADEADARAGLARREQMRARDPSLVSEEDLDSWRSRAQMAAAGVRQAEAALALAELNLRDAVVGAPVDGKIQTRTVQTGAQVQPGDVLATLVRRDPLLLRFQVTVDDAARLRPGMPARFTVRGIEGELTASLTHVADLADASSRMVPVVAQIDDPRRDDLRPGTFAEVTVPVGDAAETPVIPQAAVRPSERGFLAFVVEGEAAHERVLTLGMRTPEGLVEVRAGLRPGERLVVRGAEALRDGAAVRVDPGAGGP